MGAKDFITYCNIYKKYDSSFKNLKTNIYPFILGDMTYTTSETKLNGDLTYFDTITFENNTANDVTFTTYLKRNDSYIGNIMIAKYILEANKTTTLRNIVCYSFKLSARLVGYGNGLQMCSVKGKENRNVEVQY